MMRLGQTLLWLVLSSLAVEAQAVTWYVAKPPTGNDGNSCGAAQNPATPKATITAGLACVGIDGQFNLSDGAGDTVIVANGIYAESLAAKIPGGTAGNPFTLKAENRGTCGVIAGTCNVTIQGVGISWVIEYEWTSYNIVDGFMIDASSNQTTAVVHSFAHHHSLLYSEIYNAYDSCILGGDFTTILHVVAHNCGVRHTDYKPDQGGPNDFYISGESNEFGWIHLYNGSSGFAFYSSGAPFNTHNNILHHSLLEPPATVAGRVKYGGLGMTTGSNNQAVNNIFNGTNLSVYLGCSGCKVWNNTVYASQSLAPFDVGILIGSDASSTEVRNNITYGSPGGGITNGSGSSIMSNNLATNPLFINAGIGDFRLQAGSAAIDAGVNLASSGVTDDYLGVPRPQGAAYDIGAHEFTSGTPPGSTVPPKSYYYKRRPRRRRRTCIS